MIATAVKVFVIDAQWKIVSASTGRLSSSFADPMVSLNTTRPSCMTRTLLPTTPVRSTAWRTGRPRS